MLDGVCCSLEFVDVCKLSQSSATVQSPMEEWSGASFPSATLQGCTHSPVDWISKKVVPSMDLVTK